MGSDPDLREAWLKAFATDKQAPFGGIIVCNRPLNLAVAKAISEIFSEVIIAPEFESDARALLQKKKNLRLMRALRPPRLKKRKNSTFAPFAADCSCNKKTPKR